MGGIIGNIVQYFVFSRRACDIHLFVCLDPWLHMTRYVARYVANNWRFQHSTQHDLATLAQLVTAKFQFFGYQFRCSDTIHA